MADEVIDTTSEPTVEKKDIKVQYTFKKIDSIADTIKLSFNDIDFMTFNKSDFTPSTEDAKDFESLIGKSFDINELDCNDLTGINVIGSESHIGTVSNELNNTWKTQAHNKLGTKHFKDSKWLATLDSNSDIILYNQGNIFQTKSELSNFFKSIPYTSLPSNYMLDLSNIEVSTVVTSDTDYWGIGSDSTYNLSYNSESLYNHVKKSYKLPTTLKSMLYTFKNCSKLEIITNIPESVITMQYAFHSCTSLKNVPAIPSNVTSLYGTFFNCTSLESIPSINSTKITDMTYAFYNCKSLKKIETFENYSSNLDYTFQNCTSLTEICDIPSNIEKLTYTFAGCTNLKELPKISDSITYFNYPFVDCNNIESVKNNEILGLKYVYVNGLFVNTPVVIKNIDYIEIKARYSYTYGFKKIEKIGVINWEAPAESIQYSSTGAPTGNYAYFGRINSTYCYISKVLPDYIGALPYSLTSNSLLFTYGSTSLPTSTGYEYWVDYIATDTDYVKTITNKNISLTDHFDTLLSAGDFSINFNDLLVARTDYPHDFELVSMEVSSLSSSNTVNCSNPTLTVSDTNEATITLSCTNIADDSVSFAKINATLNYVANIDGHEFHGKTVVICDVAFDFTVVEDVQIEITEKE